MTSWLGLLLFKVELWWHFETYFVVSSEQIFERQDAGSEKSGILRNEMAPV